MIRPLGEMPNLVTLFFDQAAERAGRPFLTSRQGDNWVSISWTEAARIVSSLAQALAAIGIRPGDRVMLVSENRPEWCLSDLAIMAAGAVTVPTYITNVDRDHLHVMEDSAARAVIVSTAKLARTVMPAALRSNCMEVVIGMEDLRVGQAGALAYHGWQELAAAHAPDVEATRAAATAERGDLACIIYTSGTGGSPRGVRQHHGAILHNIEACRDVVNEDFGTSDEVFLSFLPLAHAYEHTGGQFLPVAMGGQIYYSEGLEKLASNIEEARPTIMFVVPRLFEVLKTRITKAIEKQGRTPAYLLQRAQEIAVRRAAGTLTLRDRAEALAVGALLKPKIAKRFGGRMKAMVSGGAPLNAEVGNFFSAIGVTVLQGYGQTEAGPVISCNRPKAGIAMDTVGPPLKNTEVRIAEDGEILVRGELVMHGYWRNEPETARVLKDGWLHTGDIGEFDAGGRIKITDRKKDLIVNDKGDNVAPQKVEGMLTLRPEILQAMITGDRRPYMVAVIVPDAEWTAEWCAARARTCDFVRLAHDPDYRAALGQAVEAVNRDLSVIERVRRFIIADEPFTIENEQLTPSLKIRRHVLKKVYGERLDGLYRG
jgi:long-chain acyl-CoA synthetase